MIRATDAELKALAKSICPEEYLYNYTPAGVVKTTEISKAGLEKIAAVLSEKIGVNQIKAHAAEYIEKVKPNLR